MKLAQALELPKYRQVALVGAGGKTSALYLLGRELAAQGEKVILTTTTKMYFPPQGIPLLLAEDPTDLAQRGAELLAIHNLVLAGTGREGSKVKGLSRAQLAALAALPQADAIIVEADGARGLPLKFPAPYEPVVFSRDTLVVPLLGLSALGQPLGEKNTHRWQLVCRHLGVAPGELITPELAARILCHPMSYGRFFGRNPVVPLLNQGDTAARLAQAEELAALLLENPIQRVVVGAVGTLGKVLLVLDSHR